MNLTAVSPLAFFLGLAALACALFLLQRLRVRHREIVVVTTMFWREALDEQRARTLVERFRHPLTYLLVLAIAGLIWLGVARPDSVRSEGTRHVFLLDVTRANQANLEASKEALIAALESAPRDRTEVLACGEFVRTVLAPGEDRALCAERLDGLESEPVPPSIERALRSAALAAAATEDSSVRVAIFGSAPLSPSTVDRLPEGVTLQRAELANNTAPDPRVVSFGIAPAASGEWGRVDMRAEVVTGVEVSVLIGADPIEARSSASQGVRLIEAEDLPANGGTLRLLASERELLAHELPDRPRIRVAFEGAGLQEIYGVLQLDSAVEITEGSAGADVVIGDAPSARPSLTLVSASDQDEAILIGHEPTAISEDVLESAIGALDLDRVDATELATRLGRPIAIGATPADARTVALWRELMDPEAGFVTSRAFPVLVGRAVRWLADVEPIVPYRAVGSPAPARLDAAQTDVELVTLASGEGAWIDGAARPGRDGAELAPIESASAGPWRPYTWVLVLALLLMGVEWFLYSRGRVA